jgi:hypothetical protein
MLKQGNKSIRLESPLPVPEPAYIIVRTRADGNCLFHAVAMAQGSGEASHEELRWLTAFALLLNIRGVAMKFLTREQLPFYVAQVARQGTWSGEEELAMLSWLTQRDILVYHNSDFRL